MQEQVMTDKEVGIAFMWNGRAHVVKRDHIPNLQFEWGDSVVSSGGGWSVPKGAPDRDVAFAFLKWVAEHPEQQAKWTEQLTYPTPTKKLLDLVPADIAADLPAAHDPAVIPNIELAKQSAELQKAWQAFLTS
jgi:spermidine/putrescine-binding protein